jgi:ACS family tartrate transporter-like MFS transporter
MKVTKVVTRPLFVPLDQPIGAANGIQNNNSREAMDRLEISTIAKITRRIIPYLCLCYFVSWLDRVNVGFAALSMNADLGLSPAAFGMGASIFFVGYVLCEAPSNLALRRFGARIWIARIMISWGIVSTSMAFIQGAWSFYGVRFVLGIAEAGFFPGVIYYLTTWFPGKYRARAFGLLLLTTPLSGIIGSPLSGLLFKLNGVGGLAGWQWTFLVEGLPAVALGIVTLFYLTDRPEEAKWLEPAERQWLSDAMQAERVRKHPDHLAGLLAALKSGRVWLLGTVYLGPVVGLYGLGFWLPQIIKGLVQEYGIVDPLQIGLLAALPPLGAVLGMIAWTRHSDATNERVWHTVLPTLVGAIGLVMSAYLTDPVVGMISLSIALIGINAALPVFWTMPTAFLTGAAAAVGIAVINCVGNLGGFIGPQLIGFVKESTGSIQIALLTIAVLMVISAGIALYLGRARTGAVNIAPAA